MTDLPKPEQKAKKHYNSPKLVRHGDVRGLTQSGTLNGMENGTDMSMKP
jgi:hypothetical protein